MNALKSTFRPEFINRIDEIIVFKSLTKDVIQAILDKIIDEVEQRLVPSNIHIELTKTAREKIMEESYDRNYGARPVKRYVTRNIETLLANLILEDKVKFNDTLVIDYKENKYEISRKEV